MPKFYRLTYILLITFITFTWIVLYNSYVETIPKYQIRAIAFPSDNKSNLKAFSTYYLLHSIKNKKQIHFQLDADLETNEKKMELISYEARKLKYTMDSNSVMVIKLCRDMNYDYIIRLLQVCEADGHKHYGIVGDSFIIWVETAKRPKPEKKEPELVYL